VVRILWLSKKKKSKDKKACDKKENMNTMNVPAAKKVRLSSNIPGSCC